MIDWWWLFTNTLWVLGAAILLAAVSYAMWEASWKQISWRARLGQPGYQAVIHAALLLVSLGAGANESRRWLQAAWLGLALAFVVLAVLDMRGPNRSRSNPPLD